MPGEKSIEPNDLLRALAEHFEAQTRVIAEGHAMLAEGLAALRTQVAATDERVLRVEQRVLAFESLTAANFAAQDIRLARLEQRMGGIEQRMGGIEQRMGGIEQRMDGLERHLSEFKAQTKTDFTEMRAMIKLSYAELDTRIMSIERAYVDLKARVEKLEAVRAS
jgi:chromosome segregation ATPase